MRKLYYLLFLMITGTSALQAQYTRHIIELTDKNNTAYTLATPSAYLSAKAIARRQRMGIAIDSTDLPVSAIYLDSIRKLDGVTILNTSKWLNQVLIKTSNSTSLAYINQYPFVKAVTAIAPRIATTTSSYAPVKLEQPADTILPPVALREQGIQGTTTLDYGNNYNQVHIHEGDYLHNKGFTGDNITIAMLDAGFNGYLTCPVFDSLRLNGQILGTWDYVKNETSVNEDDPHGTYCLSTMAANKPGSMVGTAPHARFWLLRTEEAATEYPVEMQNWAAAAEFADSAGVDMISTSLGYVDFDNAAYNLSWAQRDGNTSIITRAADFAAKKGMLLTVSAGNSGHQPNDTRYVSCPADADSVVTVGAVDNSGVIAYFSSRGTNGAGKLKPNIVSVGLSTVIATPSGAITTNSGTSLSNPNVCGLIACLWEAFPELSNMDIINAVQRSADRFNNPDTAYGYGLPNFRKAFIDLTARSFSAQLAGAGCARTLSWTGRDDTSMYYTIQRKTGSGSFTTIATVTGKTAAFQLNDYSYTDTVMEGDAQETVTYRIYQAPDADTTLLLYTQSSTLSDPCEPGSRLIIRPNPIQDDFTVVLGTVSGITQLNITLQDATGRTCYQYQGSAAPGNFYLTIPSRQLASGIYLLTVREGAKKLFSRKVLK